MSLHTTVVFTDLIGSTSVFESLGNAKATLAVTDITSWIAQIFDNTVAVLSKCSAMA